MIDIDYLKRNNCIIFEVISGSKAYGLNNADSDTDIKGVYILPEKEFYGFEYVDQVSDETNDTVYYEIKKFLTLLSKSNPTMLEMISTPKESILYKSDIFPEIDMKKILSKDCYNTFARYAYSQVKKARGLNKKIINPMDKKRKSILDFCTAVIDGKTINIKDWANKNEIKLETCGLTSMNHCFNLFALYWQGNDNKNQFRGIVKKDESTQLLTSSISKYLKPLAYVSFNIDGFKKYCNDYNEYWKWVDKRNEKRFSQTIKHGKKYDTKNMMHTFRLLAIAQEIVIDRVINVLRTDRDCLLSIKSGEFEYDDLLKNAEDKINELEKKYLESNLPKTPDSNYLLELLISIRKDFYIKNN
jgi:uncharacterized protein